MESIVFHAKRKVSDIVPKFTVRFAKQENELYCVVSKPYPDLESYSKKKGNVLTLNRMNCLKEKDINEVVIVKNKRELSNFLPNGIASILHFYADRAARYFKLNNPILVIRGTKIAWTNKDSYRSLAVKKSVLVKTSLLAISPKID